MDIPVSSLFGLIFQWNIAVILLLAVLGMAAITVWLWRKQYRFVPLIGIWLLFLLILLIGSWQAYNEEYVCRETVKNMLLSMTNSFAATTEVMGHAKISPQTSHDDPLYRNIHNLHAQWLRNIPFAAHIYTLRLQNEKTDTVHWVFWSESDNNNNGSVAKNDSQSDQFRNEWLELYRKGFDGEIALSTIVRPTSGAYITVIAPLCDPEHPEFVEAVLGVDFRVDQLNQMIRKIRRVSSLFLILLLALYMAAVCFIASLYRSVERLTETNRELVNAKKSADTAAKVKNDFLATMNHDIRTPMNAIIGFTDIFVQRALQSGDPEEWEGFKGILEIIQKSSQDLLTIINDFLDFSQIEANLLQIESVPMSLKQLIDEIKRLELPKTDEKNLKFSVRYHEPIPELILGDPVRLRQILLNLTDNAIKFTSKGKIEIYCEMLQNSGSESTTKSHKIKINGHQTYPEATILKISVLDTGIGISPEQMEYLFHPFAVDHSLTREFGGTGLGLSIAKRLAQLMDGNITVKSEPNVGSVFTLMLHVYLPSKQNSSTVLEKNRIKNSVDGSFDDSDSDVHKSVNDAASESESDQLLQQPLKNVRILLVEDMLINQLVISTQLRNAGAEVEVAGNGELGIQKITQDIENGLFFDVVLMDMQMPVKDGYEATTQLRAQGYNRPIIAVTAHALTGDREKTIEAGCNDYISKPVERKILIETIKKCLKSKK
ncbi:MAG: response regulator [Planctomycetaceae bacterium]|jgi:signal transduction histidine kinase/CheY-like chemotaxis protein|nr:response regulator [Planctomycetaceae bacterium]